MLDRFRKERLCTIRMGAIPPVALVDTQAIPPDPRHSVLPPPPPNTPPTLSLSLSTISPLSFPDLLAEHIPNTRVVDYLLTHVATLEDEVKKLREDRQEELNVREEMESVKAQIDFLVELLETQNKAQTLTKTSK
ncbi:hypothetical protein BLNAU_3471 [Blattamonas nauphoetae]|uniref:Uncharacterized protein n=1 Tax=Blattamonas nauphoetae TaxID=2049346 RepID=A0ABQ9YDB2_9EUKA|nr:hypothetical protein BLNAU_3471 [Blattamonas nauphoetae]